MTNLGSMFEVADSGTFMGVPTGSVTELAGVDVASDRQEALYGQRRTANDSLNEARMSLAQVATPEERQRIEIYMQGVWIQACRSKRWSLAI